MGSLTLTADWYSYLQFAVPLLQLVLTRTRTSKHNPTPLEMYKSMAYDRNLTLNDLDPKFFVYNGSDIREFDVANDSHGNLTKSAWQESTIVCLYIASIFCTNTAFMKLRTATLACNSPQIEIQSACVAYSMSTGVAFLISIIGYLAATYGLFGRWSWRLKSLSTDFVMGKHVGNRDLEISQYSQANLNWPNQFSDCIAAVQNCDQIKTWLNDNPTGSPVLVDFWSAGEKMMLTRWDGGRSK
ncbi:hypothetical protein V1505DRAFT_377588 [Lipomyces doorenjongii]